MQPNLVRSTKVLLRVLKLPGEQITSFASTSASILGAVLCMPYLRHCLFTVGLLLVWTVLPNAYATDVNSSTRHWWLFAPCFRSLLLLCFDNRSYGIIV
jgi:hypothetical protein